MAQIKSIETSYGTEIICAKCGGDLYWNECEYCDEDGYSHHDCGEDCCCCLNPENNVPCDMCDGKGGWWICPGCDGGENEQKST